MKLLLFSLVFLVSVFACASDTLDPRSAPEFIAYKASLDGWAFNRITTKDGVAIQEYCEGVSADSARCSLSLISGLAPTNKQIDKYNKRARYPETENLPNLDVSEIADMHNIDERTIKWEGQEGFVTLPAVTTGTAKENGFPECDVQFDAETSFIKRIIYRATKPFKIAPGIKANSFTVSYKFFKLDGHAFAESVLLSGKGKAFGLKTVKFDELVEFNSLQKLR